MGGNPAARLVAAGLVAFGGTHSVLVHYKISTLGVPPGELNPLSRDHCTRMMRFSATEWVPGLGYCIGPQGGLFNCADLALFAVFFYCALNGVRLMVFDISGVSSCLKPQTKIDNSLRLTFFSLCRRAEGRGVWVYPLLGVRGIPSSDKQHPQDQPQKRQKNPKNLIIQSKRKGWNRLTL